MIKIGSFFEEHVEKMVLVIVGLVCAWLLITRVIFSPNEVLYGDEKFSPGAIDEKIYEEAEILSQKLNEPPRDVDSYQSKLSEFVALLDSSVNNVNTELWPQVPYVVREGHVSVEKSGGKYRLPRIGEVTDVAVEHFRAVAYVPTVPITEEVMYEKAENEPNDIDFITVEGKFDIEGLYDRFRYSFIDDVAEEWADPCYAKPIFAAIQLQRQVLGEDGSWSGWQDVSRSKIDHNAKLCEMVENADATAASRLKVWKLQFDEPQMQIDLLQPVAYQIASAREEWFPPSLHGRFLDLQRREMLEERRAEREEERGRDTGRDDRANTRRGSRRTDTRSGMAGRSGRGATRGAGGDIYGGGYGGGGLGGQDTTRRRGGSRRRTTDNSGMGGLMTDRRSRGRGTAGGMEDYLMQGMPGERNIRRGPSINDVYIELDEITLTRRTELDKMREPLVIWAHDDTVEPGNSYRYRIRLGVFNPVAGTNQLVQQDMAKKNDVVLWSEFSGVTEPVEIPERLYFFARSIREADQVVTVQVAKYLMGYWRSEDFKVSRGEVIGSIIESEPELEPRSRSRNQSTRYLSDAGRLGPQMGAQTRTEDEVVRPETIDYSTGAVLVDVVDVNDWSVDKGLSTRRYYDMLYSFDGVNIEHMPIKTACWLADFQNTFAEINRLRKEEPEPLKPWSSGGRRGRGSRDDGYDDYMYDDMLLEDMGGGRF
jgi:hypothetical protein